MRFRDGESVDRLEWPPFSLLRPEGPEVLTEEAVDLSGPARTIQFGPYFALPRGCWSVTVIIEVINCVSGNCIGVDAFAGEVLSGVKCYLPAEGVHEFEIEFQPQKASIRLRSAFISSPEP